jgi:membrane-associated phospholipid phosphatase
MAPPRPLRVALALALLAVAPALAGCAAPPAPAALAVDVCVLEPEGAAWLVPPARVMPAPPPVGDEDLERAALSAATAGLSAEARAEAERWNASAPTTLWTHAALVAARAAQACHGRLAPDGIMRGSYPDAHAAVAGAASLLLGAAIPNETARFEPLAREAAESRVALGLAWPSDVDAGFALGQEVARVLLRDRADDGFDLPWTGSVPQRPCAWQRVPPIYDNPLEPLWGGVRPFLMASGDALRPPSPAPCGSDEARAQVRALHEASFVLTPEQREAALRWAGGQGTTSPPGMWMEIALEESAERGLDGVDTSRVTSLVAVALADAAIAAWDAKYAYWTERPVTAIQRDLDPEWLPLVETPNFPGYVSGHATFSGAASVVLAYHFPEDAVAFEGMAEEATMSRFWGGIHVMADSEEGLKMGRAIGRLAVARDTALASTSPTQP